MAWGGLPSPPPGGILRFFVPHGGDRTLMTSPTGGTDAQALAGELSQMRIQQHTLRWLLSRQALVASAVAHRAQALNRQGATTSASDWRPPLPTDPQPADSMAGGVEAAEAYLQQAVRALACCHAALSAARLPTTLDWPELEEARSSLQDVTGQVARTATASALEPTLGEPAPAEPSSPAAHGVVAPILPMDDSQSVRRLTAANHQLRSSLQSQRLQQREGDKKHAVELEELRLRERQLQVDTSARSAVASASRRHGATAGTPQSGGGSPVSTPPHRGPRAAGPLSPAVTSSPPLEAAGGPFRPTFSPGTNDTPTCSNSSPSRMINHAAAREQRGQCKEMMSLRDLWLGTAS